MDGYHLAVYVYVYNSKGEYNIVQLCKQTYIFFSENRV